MPTYVYGCDTCGHRFEIFQKFSDAPLRECPQCGAPLRKIFQPAGIVFKGSGWYSTDSRAKSRSADGDGRPGKGGAWASGDGPNPAVNGTSDKTAPGASDKSAASTPAAD